MENFCVESLFSPFLLGDYRSPHVSGSLYLKHDMKMKCYSRSWLRWHGRYLRVVQDNTRGDACESWWASSSVR